MPPNLFMTKRWASITPDNFRFAAKVPRSITHEKRLSSESEKDLRYFFHVMGPLRHKLLTLLLQLPPSLTAKEGLKKLEVLIPKLDPNYRYAIEVRHTSWFDNNNEDFYKLLSDNNICLAWSQLDTIQTPPELTSDFICLRFIGDRSIDEKDFGKIQKNRLEEMKKWAGRDLDSRNPSLLSFSSSSSNWLSLDMAGVGPFKHHIKGFGYHQKSALCLPLH